MSESSRAVALPEVAQEWSPQGRGELARRLPAETTGDDLRLPHAAAGEGKSKAVTKPRVRRHTSRATTGCSTCNVLTGVNRNRRARRIKCDEAFPTCRNCSRQNRECDMHTPLLWRSKRGEKQITHEPASSFTSSTHAPQSFELPVSLWLPSQRASTVEDDWVQTCYHWGTLFRRIHPERRITKQMPFSAELTGFIKASDPMKLVIILVSLATLLLEERPGAPNYTNLARRPDLASYIKKYNDYNTVVLSSLSRDINNLSPASRVLNRLGNFIQSEIVLNSPTLPLHLKGFATILSVRGGIRTVLERNEASNYAINNTLVATTALNTTSPAKACLSSATYLVDDHAYLLYTSNLLENFPCPTQLYRCLVEINWLRTQQAVGQLDGRQICAAAAAIAAAIQGFNPETWNERPDLRSSEVRCLIAQLYQSATDLYLRLSLAECVGVPLSPSQRIKKANYTTALAERLAAICGVHISLAWPLTVAGAGLGCAAAGYQLTVDRHLLAISRMTAIARGVFVSLQSLRKFWASEKTGWEDCFSEWHLCCF